MDTPQEGKYMKVSGKNRRTSERKDRIKKKGANEATEKGGQWRQDK